MSDLNLYSSQDEQDMQHTAEAAVEYEAAVNVDRFGYVADDILIDAIRCAELSREQGCMVSNSDVYEYISHRMEWK